MVSYTHSERRGDMRNLGAGTVWNFAPANGGRTTLLRSPKYLGDNNTDAIFAAVKYSPNDNFKLVYRFDFTDNDSTSDGQGYAYAQPPLRSVIASQPNLALMTPMSRERPDAVNNAGVVASHSRNLGHSLTVSYDLSDDVSVKNILAYRRTRVSSPWQDISGVGGLINTGGTFLNGAITPVGVSVTTLGTPLLLSANSSTALEKQWSNELQVNVDTERFTLMAGALYYHLDSERGPYGEEGGLGTVRSGTFRVYPGFAVPYAGQLASTGGRLSHAKITSTAIYAQSDVHITPQIDLVAGLRYTKDRKRGTGKTLVSGTVSTTFPMNYDDDEITYTAGLNYRVREDALLYLKYSTGFISGGSLSAITYQPEKARSWEAGLKAQWLNRRLQTNLAVFDVDYSNLQLNAPRATLTPPRPEISNSLTNAGDAKATGFEFEAVAVPAAGLTVSASAGYTNFKFKTLLPGISTGIAAFLPNQRPEWTTGFAVQYTSSPVYRDAVVNARVDAKWKSRSYATTTVPLTNATFTASKQAAFVQALTVDPSWTVNARIALEELQVCGTKMTLAAWAGNIFDNDSVSFATSLGAVLGVNYERAPTYGVDLVVDF